MLLSQQAKLINLNSSSAEIAISEKWINMIQSRKSLIEDAFYKAQGSPTKVILIEEKGNFLNNKKNGVISKKIEEKKEFKVNQKANKNDLSDGKQIQTKNNLDTNSIDEKAKKFAEFFNGEIVNLE